MTRTYLTFSGLALVALLAGCNQAADEPVAVGPENASGLGQQASSSWKKKTDEPAPTITPTEAPDLASMSFGDPSQIKSPSGGPIRTKRNSSPQPADAPQDPKPARKDKPNYQVPAGEKPDDPTPEGGYRLPDPPPENKNGSPNADVDPNAAIPNVQADPNGPKLFGRPLTPMPDYDPAQTGAPVDGNRGGNPDTPFNGGGSTEQPGDRQTTAGQFNNSSRTSSRNDFGIGQAAGVAADAQGRGRPAAGRPQGGTGSNDTFSEIEVKLVRGVAVPQLLPNGTHIGFDVEYMVRRGVPNPNARYIWVLKDRAGQRVDLVGPLERQGSLRTFVKQFQPTSGPYEMWIEEVRGGKRQRISRPFSLVPRGS